MKQPIGIYQDQECNVLSSEQTPFADEDHQMQSKARIKKPSKVYSLVPQELSSLLKYRHSYKKILKQVDLNV